MNDERRTPRWLFDLVNEAFQFNFDLAAAAENALVERFYTKENSALEHTWFNHTGWCNPPYSRGQLIRWVRKAKEERNATTLMLIPGDNSTKASQFALANANAVLFLAKRLAFDEEESGAKFANWLVLFNGTRRNVRKLHGLDLGVVL